MESHKEIKCGCKGIRTCLVCEKEKSDTFVKSVNDEKKVIQCTYCPYCNLCLPSNVSDVKIESPLYLGQLRVMDDFIDVEEESALISEIDRIPWMPSQSGRRKQDFGPKVNFKKKKGKIGSFKGFPLFSKNLIKRFQQHRELANFFPVELCHLDYSPDRGSAIEPHMDDSWIWGERLVTVNLVSSTVLTLTPANLQNCSCKEDSTTSLLSNENNIRCNHRVPPLSSSHPSGPDHSIPVRDLCSLYRTEENNFKCEIQVSLPPRSLFVLAGCSRHNWFHEIKRQSITTRRLAMTFRELSANFLEGGKEKDLGDELLEIGRRFCEIEV